MQIIDKASLLAMLFYLAGGSIKGVTRLHKIVFLIQAEVGMGSFVFEPSKYGPYSQELDSMLRSLMSGGLIAVDEVFDPVYDLLKEKPAKILRALPEFLKTGEREYLKLRESDPARAVKLKLKVKAYSSIPITYLLAYIYKKYPEYSVMSVIKEKVELWRKYYGLRL